MSKFEDARGTIQVWHYKIDNSKGRYSLPCTNEIVHQYQLVEVGARLIDSRYHVLPNEWQQYPVREFHKIKR